MRQRTQFLILIVCAIPLILFGNSSQAQVIPEFGSDTMPEAGKWYVSPGGNNSNSCASPAAPCASINVAIGKASEGDTIYVQVGTYYTDPDSIEVIHLDKGVNITGGWNESFTTRSGRSVIDGNNFRGCLSTEYSFSATISHLILRNGAAPAGGVSNRANLTIQDSIVQDNPSSGVKNTSEGTLTLVDSVVERNHSGNGGGIQNQGNLTLIRTAVIGNIASNYGGGIDSSGNHLVIINSTVSDNIARVAGGISVIYGDAKIYNSTITQNRASSFPGGVDVMEIASLWMQNSIMAENHTGEPGAVECQGAIDSGGYNLIGDSAGCGFVPATGDILDLPPQMTKFHSYYPLLPASPAIDAANPTGCLDEQNNLIQVDQRGFTRPVDGNSDGTTVCDIGAYEFDPAYQLELRYLPIVKRPCPDMYYDDFHSSSSGWPLSDTPNLLLEYTGGEYRMLLRTSPWYAIVRPGIKASNFDVSVDVRNISGEMGSYGIAFNIAEDWSELYTLEIYPDMWYGLYHYYPGGMEILEERYSNALKNFTASNHISIRQHLDTISAYANGELLTNVAYEPITPGEGYLGLIGFSYYVDNLDIRFDNYLKERTDCENVLENGGSHSAVLSGWTEKALNDREYPWWQGKHATMP